MKQIDQETIQNLYQEAEQSSRKRAHRLLHNSHQDKVQRLLIGLVNGSIVEPHFHEQEHQWEMFLVLDGVIRFNLHNLKGEVVETLIIGPKENVFSIEVQPLEIHSLECISDKALLLEVKEGPFDPQKPKTFLPESVF